MRCLKCGHLLSTSDIYCSHCGLKVQESRTDRLIAYYKAQICFVYDKFEKVTTKRNQTLTFIKAHSKYGWSLLNLNGTNALSEHYSDIVPHIEKDEVLYFFVKRGDKWALRTEDEYITEYKYDYMDWYFWGGDLPGYCLIKNNDKEGVMKIKTGEIVFDCIFDNISNASSDFQDYIRSAKIDGKYGIINIAQKSYLTSFEYNNECTAFEAYREKFKAEMDPLQRRTFEIIHNHRPRLTQKDINKTHEFTRQIKIQRLNLAILRLGENSIEFQQFLLENPDMIDIYLNLKQNK